MATANEFDRKFSRELPVTLNDSELQTYGRMLADKVREEELAEEKKKQANAEHSARIKTIRVEIKRIADARAKGEELRPVQCGERLKGNVIEIVRLDRLEVVDTRPAELRDLQTSLPGTELPAEMPEDVEPLGDDEAMGGPDKTGRGVQSLEGSNVVQGNFGQSSSGDTVYNGAPDDHAENEDREDGETFPEFSEPDDVAAFNADDEDELDRKLREREEQQHADAEAKKATKTEPAKKVDADEKPKRDRSKKSNDAKKSKKK